MVSQLTVHTSQKRIDTEIDQKKHLMLDIIGFEDIGAVYKNSFKRGTYHVGDKKFYYKIDALQEFARTKQPIEWDFHKDVFAAQVKKPRLNIPLTELYRLRAQQLRDKCDYLVLAYSGGSDSDNILEICLRNNIKIDEIVVEQSFKLFEKNNFVPSTNKNYQNWPSEWYFVIKPKLDQISKLYPQIKITVLDSSENFEVDDDEYTSRVASVPSSYVVVKRMRGWDRLISNRRDTYKNVTLMSGVDKCYPTVRKGTFGFTISDSAALALTMTDMEFFYWTPDMPEIVVEQAWRIWDYLHLNPKIAVEKFSANQKDYRTYHIDRNLNFDDIIKTICYPYWDINKFQANKALGQLHHNAHWLVNKFQNERWYQSWHSNFKSTLASLPLSVYQNGDPKNDYVRFANYHALGSFNMKEKND